jgi:PleD family two-component response regulator
MPTDAVESATDTASRSQDVERLERELEHSRGQLERLSLTDAATGLANRRALRAAVEAELARVARRPSPLSLVVVDVDHVSKINASTAVPRATTPSAPSAPHCGASRAPRTSS